MSRGPQPPGRRPENDPGPGGEDTVAEVFNRFSLDSGRRRRRRRAEPPPAESGPAGPQRAEEVSAESGEWPSAESTDLAARYSSSPYSSDGYLSDQQAPESYGSGHYLTDERRSAGYPPDRSSPDRYPWPATPDLDAREPQPPSDMSAVSAPYSLGAASSGEEVEQHAEHIRAYAWTGGRTRSNYQLELETLVSTSEYCWTARLERLEHQSIAEHCRHPRSVAEVGALLSVPLGVAKVLIGDMADLGLITVHNTVTETGTESHLKLMERVLSGLRRL